MTLSVVIPALNARDGLTACLGALDGADEILLVDGGSRDGTPVLAGLLGARVIEAPRGRGVQMHLGALEARGDWLLFLHADTQLAGAWRTAVAQHIAGGPGKAGFFDLRLDDPAWQARLIERGVAVRARALGLPYGDQGLLISRALYDAIGGFRALPLMEDVDIVRRLGRKRLHPLDASALTSAKRWRRDGWLRRSGLNLACLALYHFGVPPGRIAVLYR